MNRFGIIAKMLLPLVLSGMVGAFESPVLTVEEKNLYMDLGPEFQVYRSEVDTNTSGIFSYDMMINNTDPAAGRVFVSVMSVYDDVMRRMRSASLVDLFLSAEICSVEDGGDEITGSWNASSVSGENVTVYAIVTETPWVQSGIYYMSCWNPSENDYVLMATTMDQNATERLIETLTIC